MNDKLGSQKALAEFAKTLAIYKYATEVKVIKSLTSHPCYLYMFFENHNLCVILCASKYRFTCNFVICDMSMAKYDVLTLEQVTSYLSGDILFDLTLDLQTIIGLRKLT